MSQSCQSLKGIANTSRENMKSYLDRPLFDYMKRIPGMLVREDSTLHINNTEDEDYDEQSLIFQHEYLKNKDELIWSEFSNVTISMPDAARKEMQKRMLILTYTNGFQVYEICQDSFFKISMIEIVSKRDASAVKLAKVLLLDNILPKQC
jgi:hypothetical protein